MKFCFKSFVAGVIISSLGITGVLAASTIKSVEFNSNRVVFEGTEIDMSQSPMLSVVKEGETAINNYMPLRSVLEAIGYEVSWNGESKTVYINAKGASTKMPTVTTPAPVEKAADISEKIIGGWMFEDISEDTGNWFVLSFRFNKDGTVLQFFHSKVGSNERTGSANGTYKVEGTKVITELTENGSTFKKEFEVTFAEDGESWSGEALGAGRILTFVANDEVGKRK